VSARAARGGAHGALYVHGHKSARKTVAARDFDAPS
jgi:hypothetical protein